MLKVYAFLNVIILAAADYSPPLHPLTGRQWRLVANGVPLSVDGLRAFTSEPEKALDALGRADIWVEPR